MRLAESAMPAGTCCSSRIAIVPDLARVSLRARHAAASDDQRRDGGLPTCALVGRRRWERVRPPDTVTVVGCGVKDPSGHATPVPPGRRGSRRAPGRPTAHPMGTRRATTWRLPRRKVPDRCRAGGRRRRRRAAWVPAGLPAQRRELGDDFGELFGVVQLDGEETLVPRRPAHWPGLAVVARDPHRYARPLDRPGQETHAVDRVVLAAVVHRFARPGGRQDLERLVEHARASAVVELLAGDRVLAREPVAPRPTPSVSRPPLSRSSVAVSRATLTGLRRASGVTIGPSRIRSVAVATAVSVIHGSATSTTGSW